MEKLRQVDDFAVGTLTWALAIRGRVHNFGAKATCPHSIHNEAIRQRIRRKEVVDAGTAICQLKLALNVGLGPLGGRKYGRPSIPASQGLDAELVWARLSSSTTSISDDPIPTTHRWT